MRSGAKRRSSPWAPRRRLAGMCLGVFAVAWAAGCTTLHMKPPGEVGPGVDEVRVVGLPLVRGALMNEDFAIGLDAITHVRRRLDTGESFRTLFGFERHNQSGYGFDLKHGDHVLHAQCDVRFAENGTTIGRITFRGRTTLIACACGSIEAPEARLQVALSEGSEGGTLQVGRSAYEVHGVHEVQEGAPLSTPAGYRVDGDGFVGAVDILPPGHVWLDKTIEPDQQADFTCLFAGLLLYTPSSD